MLDGIYSQSEAPFVVQVLLHWNKLSSTCILTYEEKVISVYGIVEFFSPCKSEANFFH